MSKFYITASIPYVNAAPHIGHALEFAQTDALARYQRMAGRDVLALSGADENALKNVQAAEKTGLPVEEFVNKNSDLFLDLAKKIDISFDVWQKGSDKLRHYPSSQKLWELCSRAGDIYKKSYKGLYCVGCEAFYNRDELDENDECAEHPGRKLDEVEEENYFFRLSKYNQRLLSLIENNEYKIIPEFRKNEVLSFLKKGLTDISISRSNERAKNWGVPVPGDSSQKIYVWFDALNIYQSGIGFGWNEEKYQKWHPADVHVIGKGIVRFHAVYWPAFLISAGLSLPKNLFVHGYLTVDGQKMSKTLGNVINPVELIKSYGSDPLRLYLLRGISSFGDGDFSEEKFKKLYNADLAHGLGNLIARTEKLCENAGFNFTDRKFIPRDEYKNMFADYHLDKALGFVFNLARESDLLINKEEPWKIKNKTQLNKILNAVVVNIRQIALELKPFLPKTAETIEKRFSGQIRHREILFPRIK